MSLEGKENSTESSGWTTVPYEASCTLRSASFVVGTHQGHAELHRLQTEPNPMPALSLWRAKKLEDSTKPRKALLPFLTSAQMTKLEIIKK